MAEPVPQIPGPLSDGLVHPEEIRAAVHLRVGDTMSVRAKIRITPAELVTAGLMISAIIVASAACMWTARRPR